MRQIHNLKVIFMYEKDFLLQKTEKILRQNVYEVDPKYPWYPYRMVCPDKTYFPGVWNWDSAFHAIGFLGIDPQIAKEQILGFTAFQLEENGIFPDLLFYRENLNNSVTEMYVDKYIEYHYTKPPVMADAAWRVYAQTGDSEFLKTVYPRLVKNENFWRTERFFDGLFHFDADTSEGEAMRKTWVGYESGMDNSPRWDSEPYNYYAIDLNCYMVTVYRALFAMSNALGTPDERWRIREKELIDHIETRLWDEEKQIYNDYNFVTRSFGTVMTPVCFMPLYIGTASKERAKRCEQVVKTHFLPGMPTVAFDDATYSLDYWRGPCWLNLAYFAAKGLKNYGYDETADHIKDTILTWVQNDGDFVHENYDAKTGNGLCQKYFSWSCVFVREFLLNW